MRLGGNRKWKPHVPKDLHPPTFAPWGTHSPNLQLLAVPNPQPLGKSPVLVKSLQLPLCLPPSYSLLLPPTPSNSLGLLCWVPEEFFYFAVAPTDLQWHLGVLQ